MIDPPLTHEDCFQSAQNHFATLKSVFHDAAHGISPSTGINLNFWQLGCVFDTMLDYFLIREEVNPTAKANPPKVAQDVAEVLSDARHGYMYGIAANQAVWYDDWSWYGIASTKAFDPAYQDFFSTEDLKFFQQITLALWGLIHAGDYGPVADSVSKDAWATSNMSPHVGPHLIPLDNASLTARSKYHRGTTQTWQNVLDNLLDMGEEKFFTTAGKNWAKPRFDHRVTELSEPSYFGCWQYDMYSKELPLKSWDGNAYQKPYPSGAPNHQGPFQFTLMSGLYLVFAMRLAKAAELAATNQIKLADGVTLESAETYKRCAAPVYRFLNQWYGVKNEGLNYGLFRKDDEDNPTKLLIRERMPTYANDGASYPTVQGFESDHFWAGDQGLMLDSFLSLSILDTDTANLPAEKLAEKLVDGVEAYMTKDNVVQPFQGKNFPDPPDYASGSGIFWRYVLHACRNEDGDFLQYMVSKVKPPNRSDNFVTGSAANTENPGNKLFNPFNIVAVEIAACHILKNAGY